MRIRAAVLFCLFAGIASAQSTIRPGGGGGSSTITAGTTATSGCTDGAFLYSLTSLIRCGTALTTNGTTITTPLVFDIGGAAAAGTVGISVKHADPAVFQTTGALPYGVVRIIGPSSNYGVLSVESTSNFGTFSIGLDTGLGAPLVRAMKWDGNGSVFFGDSAAGGLTAASRFSMVGTITAGGTTGNQTINLISGTVNFAAAATAITVTNNTVTTSSIVYAMARTNDTTCSVKNVVPAAGSFVINMTAACNAETSVGWFVAQVH